MGYQSSKGSGRGGGGGGGIASRYLAAIGAAPSSASMSQRSASASPPPASSLEERRHHRQAASGPAPSCAPPPSQPQHPRPARLILGRRSAPPSSSKGSSAISPKSTRTERTYPLDQSAGDDEGSSSWDDDQISPTSNSVLVDVTPPEQEDEQGRQSSSYSLASRTPSHRGGAAGRKRQQLRHDDASGVRIMVMDAADRDECDQSSLSASRVLELDTDPDLSSPLSHPSDEPLHARPSDGDGDRFGGQPRKGRGVVIPQRGPGGKEPPSWGAGASASYRIFLEARQLFAGCEGGPAPTEVSLDGSVEAGGDGGGGGAAGESSTRPGAAHPNPHRHPLAASSHHRRAPSDVKSDVTTASTQVATNRAVDVAHRQRQLFAEQQRRKGGDSSESSPLVQQLRSVPEQQNPALPSAQIPRGPLPSRTHPPRYSFGNCKHVSPAQLEAKSVLSLSSNDESSMSRTQPQHHAVGVASALSRPLHDESNDCLDPPATDRLSQHVQSTTAAQRQQPNQLREYAQVSGCERSQSSSVGVEIDDKLAPNSHSTKQVKASFQNKSVLKNELPNEAVAEDTMAAAPLPSKGQQGLVQMQTKRFAMGGSRPLQVPAPPRFSIKPGPPEEGGCLSPPQIHRTTDPSNVIEPQASSSSSSPDPIFCTQSESSPSHSAATSSMLSSSILPHPPTRQSSGTSLLYSHVDNDEKEEKQDEYHISRSSKSQHGNGDPRLSQSAMLPAERSPPPAASHRNAPHTSVELRSASVGDTRPAYPHRAASSMYWSKKTQSCTAVTIASLKAPTPQPSLPFSTRQSPRHDGQLESTGNGQHPLLLPVLSNVRSQDSVQAHPAPKPRQSPHLNGDIRERLPRSTPAPDSPVEAAPCSSFLEAIARFEKKPRKATPSEESGHPILRDHAPLELRVQAPREADDEEKPSVVNAVGSQSSIRRGIDSQPITQRRRRGIELVLGRSGRSTLTFEEEDLSGSKHQNDDDTASVKSLRELFEPPSPPEEKERSVRKMRAMFEKPKSQYTTRSDAVNGPLKDVISKFDVVSSSKASRSRSRRTKPRASSLQSISVGEEELDGQSVAQQSMTENAHGLSPKRKEVHSSSVATSNAARALDSGRCQALEMVSSSATLREADERSLLSREYDNLAATDRKILSSKSFQERRETALSKSFDLPRPRSADPALSHARAFQLRANAAHTKASTHQRTLSNRPDPINLVPSSRELLEAGPPGSRKATSDLYSQDATMPSGSTKFQTASVASGGPCIKELAASSFILSVRQHIADPPTESVPLESVATRRSTPPARRVLAEDLPSTSHNASIHPVASHSSSRPIDKVGETSTLYSIERRTSVPPGQTSRMTVSVANARSKSPGRMSYGTESSRSSFLPRERRAAVSFLNDNPDRMHTLERAHAALVKPGSLHFFEEKKESSPRESPDGAVSESVGVSQALGSVSDAVDDDSQSGEEGSEFSDGVTLDLSIAEVSNLTTPTALGSRADPCDAGQGPGSSDPGSKSVDLAEVEAKRSEASSSQTSEAAAPLLARALGIHPRSDEFSANSFFAKRALIAKHWSKTSSLDVRSPCNEDEKDSKDDSFGGSGGWDLTRIETSFPNTEPLQADDSIFDFESGWQPFNADPVPISARRSEPTQQPFPPMDHSSPNLMSLAKTPTRSNTSVYAGAPPSRATSMISMVHMPKAPKPSVSPHCSGGQRYNHPVSPFFEGNPPTAAIPPVASVSAKDPDSQSHVHEGNTSAAPRLFSRTYPGTELSSDDPSFWRRRAGVTLSSIRRRDSLNPQPPVHAIERLPVRFPPSSAIQQHSSRPTAQAFTQLRTSASPTPPPSSVVTSTTSSRLTERAGNHYQRHAAVMDRLRMLKEARLRRTSGYSPHNAALNGYDLPDPDETDHSTQSSTQFGGSTFLASLDVD